MKAIGAIAIGLLAVVMNTGLVHASASTTRVKMDISTRIRQEIATLPETGIWDWVEAELRPDGTVVLSGEVMLPSSKTDAEYRIRRIEEVSNVVNEINVLPLSGMDNSIRSSVYRSLFNRNSSLLRYALGANPAIHIIVENGRVTLKGVVSNAMDKQLASIAANQVWGILSVDNQLRLESEL